MRKALNARRLYVPPTTAVIPLPGDCMMQQGSRFQNPGGHNSAEDEDFVPSTIAGGGHNSAEDEDFTPSSQGWGGHTSAQDENW